MAVLSSVSVNLALTCVESAFYGIFFVLATTSLAVLVVRHGKDSSAPDASFSVRKIVRSPLFVATIMLLMTVSGHWFITVQRLFEAFLYHGDGQQPSTYYLLVETPTHVTASAFVIASVIVGDMILTYRIWIVWGRRYSMIIFPVLCTMGYAAAGISVVQLFAVFSPGESIFVFASQRRVITTASLTLSTNIYGTVSIAYRIWTTNRAFMHDHIVSGMTLPEALVIFIESAALYTSWTLFFLISYSASSILEAFAFHCIPAATGISFMLIIVRVGLGFSWSEDAGAKFGVSGVAARKPARQDSDRSASVGYPLRMITLSVTRTVERETDFALPQEDDKRYMNSDIGECAAEV